MSNLYEYLKSIDAKPAFFGLGFIQVKVSPTKRYHFYHPSLVATINIEEEVHDHRYDFESKILKGELKNKRYEFIKVSIGDYTLHNVSCSEDIKLTEDEKKLKYGTLSYIREETIKENESYKISSDEFHTVMANNCITELTRGDVTKRLARVIRKRDEKGTCPFAKKLTEEDCWNIIKEMSDFEFYMNLK